MAVAQVDRVVVILVAAVLAWEVLVAEIQVVVAVAVVLAAMGRIPQTGRHLLSVRKKISMNILKNRGRWERLLLLRTT